jgi:uncharacterized protein
MPDGASKLRDVNQLADTGAAFEYELAVAQLPGFPLHRSAGAGTVRAQLRFGREQGWPVAQVALEAEVDMICQRCMHPMRVRVGAVSPVLLVDSEQAGENAPEGSETFLAAEGRISNAALIAEELMLALPIVPLHEAGAPCVASASPPALEAAAAPEPVTRPFADLRALLERGGKNRN